MIRVNLVRSHISQQMRMEGADSLEINEVDAADLQRQGGIRFLMLLLVPMALYAWEFQNIPDLKAKLNRKTTEYNNLVATNEQAKGYVDEIKKFEEDQARLQKQIDTLDSLQKERLREVKILDNLQKDIPEKVWLTQLDFQGINFKLSGVAVSDSDLTVLMENLSKSVFLKEVNLVKSSETPTERGTFKSFEIACIIDKPQLQSAEAKKQ